jgi:cation transport regulator ChaC
MAGHVFGYGSLVTQATRLVTLRGHRRVWGVAMDNRVVLPGYKVYELPDGSRPPVAVAFLDLEPDPGTAVDGCLLRVEDEALAALDERERQYTRIEVGVAIEPAPPAGDGPVWAYVGRDEGRGRAAAGRLGSAEVLIQRAYVDHVESAFAALGDDALARYRASTEPPPFPVAELARVNLPY